MDEQILSNVNRKLDHIIEQSRELIDEDEFKRQLESGSERVKEIVRKYPVGSMAAGLVAGFLVAKLFSRK